MAKLIEKKREELREDLYKKLKLWRRFVELFGKKHVHYTLTSEWWKNIEEIRGLVNRIEKKKENQRELLKELFGRKIWAGGIMVFNAFLNNASDEDIRKLSDIVLDVRNSEHFKKEWVKEIFGILRLYYNVPESTQKNVLNMLGELFGKLHIEDFPILNSTSKYFLRQYYEFDENDYESFRVAFEMFKKEYQHIVGRLSDIPH